MKQVRIISAPFHVGAFNQHVGAGPTRLLDDGLEADLEAAGLAPEIARIPPVDDFTGEIGRSFEIKRRIAREVRDAREAGAFPLVLAGNCCATVGVWSGLGDDAAGLVWFDAHPDFNTPDEMTSGYFDSMGIATMAGQCWHALAASIPGFRTFDVARLVYCGIRDFDAGQLEKVEAAGIHAAVGRLDGPTDYARELDEALRQAAFDTAMFHLDVDCLDPSVGIPNEYAAPGGLGADELITCLDRACAAARPLSLTIASFDPRHPGSEAISAAARAAAVRVASSWSGARAAA